MSNYSANSLTKDQNHAWSILLGMVPAKTTVLDIGCSSGNFGKELIEKKGCTVDGIELDDEDSKKAAKNLRKVWNIDIERDSLEDITGTYDVIVLADVIEHLIHPSLALQRVKKLLKPGGKLVFSVPNMAHVSVRLGLLAGNFSYTETGVLDKTHLHYYDFEELSRVFEEAGMGIEKIDYPKLDYPETLIEKKLKELGLQSTDAFYRHLDQPEYYAYQFIGIAKYLNSGAPQKTKLREKQAVQNDFMLLSDEIGIRKKHEKTLEKELADQRKETSKVNEQLQKVLNSKSYKLARKFAKASSYAKRPKSK